MLTPKFWYPKNNNINVISLTLIPVGYIYSLLTKLRFLKSFQQRFEIPVVCIGNLNAGGTGKTPTTIAAAQFLIESGYNVHLISSGYGGITKGPMLVNAEQHSASEVGDEPLLLSAFAPTWVAKERSAAIKMAIIDGAQIILLDDGFQDPSVYKDLTILTVNANKGFGNKRCIPSGPLREKLSSGLKRADFLISIGADASQEQFIKLHKSDINLPLGRASLEVLSTGISWKNAKVIAFAGIAHPENFFNTLRLQGAELIECHALGDHQKLSSTLIKRLIENARAEDAQLVTTEKDYVRLPRKFRSEVITLPVRLKLREDLTWKKIFNPIFNYLEK